MIVMPGPHTRLITVNVGELYSTLSPARCGAPSAASTGPGSRTARATTSRTPLGLGSELAAASQSARKPSMSNDILPLHQTYKAQYSIHWPCGGIFFQYRSRRNAFEAMPPDRHPAENAAPLTSS